VGLRREALEAIEERVVEVDGGLECPYDCHRDPFPICELDVYGGALVAECPEHGRFWVDVSYDLENEVREREEDLPYQIPHEDL